MKYKNFLLRAVNLLLILGILWQYQQVALVRAAAVSQRKQEIAEVEAYNASVLQAQSAAQAEQSQSGYRDGTYEGSAYGFGDVIRVSVTIQNGKMTDIAVLDASGEDKPYYKQALPLLDEMPQVIHCNDWQTALVPVYRQDLTGRWDALRGIRTVFTIHNIEYQGKFGANTVSDLFGLDRGWYDGGTLEMDGCVNLMKGAMLCADAVTTVSPTYARQLRLSAYAQGMESVVQRCGEKFSGIVNGIDTAVFDPATDPVLPAHYSVRNLRGKATCKKALQQELGLQVQSDVPVISMVSRLVGHKGIDLICESLDNIMHTGCQLVLQGSGEERYESFFRYAENRYKGRLCAYIGYNEELAHRIYAGSDLFLMPSRSEPCGLSQMIAMRYGAVPIVRQTGGLADTVRSCQMGQEDGNGFVFANYSAFDMQYVISQAVELYRSDLHGFRRVQRCGMTDDFSWNVSAGAYEALYENITDTSR